MRARVSDGNNSCYEAVLASLREPLGRTYAAERISSGSCSFCEQLPQFDFDPSPRAALCERCGKEENLRFVIFRGRTRYLGRTLSDLCAEAVLELLIEVEPERGAAPP